MIWRSSRPAISRCGSTKLVLTHLRRGPPRLPAFGVAALENDRAVRLFASAARLFSEKDPDHHNAVHDVATALRVASPDPIPITVQSTIRTIRNQKKHSFAKLGDGSTVSELQVLLDPAQAEDLSTGTAVRITGTLQPSPAGLQQSHELHAKEVTIIGPCDPETYPIQKKYQSPEFLRTFPHLRLRLPWNGLLARLRSEVEYSCSEYFHQHGYIRAHPPIITSSDCEGAGEVFTVTPASEDNKPQDLANDNHQSFFREPKYLTVSSQLHLEAYTHAHRAVWTLSPTFRAERSDTPRHLSEFYMLEAELQTTSLSEVMDVVESLLRYVGRKLSNSTLGQEMLTYSVNTPLHTSLSSNWSALDSPSPYPRITYTDAINHLQSAAQSNPSLFTNAPQWGSSLALEHEKYIASSIGQGKAPVFITDYPRAIKPFYMSPSASQEDPQKQYQTASSFDLLVPSVAELVGGSMREHRYEHLLRSMREKGVSEHGLEWYLALRRYGSIPHGGFGLGFDRLLCYLACEGNVRDTVGWPRWVGRCDG